MVFLVFPKREAINNEIIFYSVKKDKVLIVYYLGTKISLFVFKILTFAMFH